MAHRALSKVTYRTSGLVADKSVFPRVTTASQALLLAFPAKFG